MKSSSTRRKISTLQYPSDGLYGNEEEEELTEDIAEEEELTGRTVVEMIV